MEREPGPTTDPSEPEPQSAEIETEDGSIDWAPDRTKRSAEAG